MFVLAAAFTAIVGFTFWTQQRRKAPKLATTLVPPATPSAVEGLYEPLSGLDQSAAFFPLALGFRFDSLLDVDRLRQGLARALDTYPAYAGRLDTSCKHTGLVVRNMAAGARFEVMDRPEADVAGYSRSKQWLRVGALLPAEGVGYAGPSDPLLCVRLTRFPAANVSVLHFSCCHGIGDAFSVCQFLQAWSYHCGGILPRSFPSPPPSLRQRRRRVHGVLPERPSSYQGLLATSPVDPCPIGWNLRAFVPRVLWAMLVDRPLELRVSASRLKEWKASLHAALPAGEWLSSFEVLMAILLFAKYEANAWKSIRITPVVSLRGRCSSMPSNYFGNAIIGPSLPDVGGAARAVAASALPRDKVLGIARRLHSELRRTIADERLLSSCVEWYDAVQDLGFGTHYFPNFMTEVLADGNVMLNTWQGYPWLDMDMGSGRQATSLLFVPVPRNVWVLMPRDSATGDLTVHVSLPPAQAGPFVRALADAHTPVSLVE